MWMVSSVPLNPGVLAGARELPAARWRDGFLSWEGHVPAPGASAEGRGGTAVAGVGLLCRWGPCEGLGRLCRAMATVGVYSAPVACWGLSRAVICVSPRVFST